jgi:hypothetical protein
MDRAERRRMIDHHPDAYDLARRLAGHHSMPTTIASATTDGDRTTFEIELNGRPHRLTLERIRS